DCAAGDGSMPKRAGRMMARCGDGIYLRGKAWCPRMIPAVVTILMLALTLSSSASAECAWVLWMIAPPGRYDRVAAHPRYEQCLEYGRGFALVDATTEIGPKPGWKHIDKVNGAEVWNGERFVRGYQCWPDTADPRGGESR